jgi:hypothetical protein
VIVGAEEQRSTQRSHSTVRVAEDSETWVSLGQLSSGPYADATRLAIAVDGAPSHRAGLPARAIVVLPTAQPPPRLGGSSLRLVPRLRGDSVVAELSVVGTALGAVDGMTLVDFEGQVRLPLGRWARIAHTTSYGELRLGEPGYPGAAAQSLEGEVWARFDLAP